MRLPLAAWRDARRARAARSVRPFRLLPLVCLLVLVAAPVEGWAQTWGTLAGTVTDAETGDTLPGVTVLVAGTNYGTAAEADGRYEMRLPTGRHAILFSAVGYAAVTDSVTIRRDAVTRLDVAMTPATIEMEGVTVEEEAAPQEAGVYTIDPEDVQAIPSPFKDGFRALKVVPGVATNSELSQQYSVRGGGFNENLIFIDGFEVYMPFRAQQGEQEGLGLLNPDMAESITFYTGGFPARYGGKLSSALDVQYARPEGAVTGAAAVSGLDASVTAGASAFDGDLSWIGSVRNARPGRFYGTQDLQGDYDPNFTDAQAKVSYRLADGHRLDVLGIVAHHDFVLDPSNSRTYFGTLARENEQINEQATLQSLWQNYDGNRNDGYVTRFGGVRLTNDLGARFEAQHGVAYFGTEESEFYDITSESELYQVAPGANPDSDPELDAGHVGIGTSRDTSFADNRVRVETLTGQGRYRYLAGTRHGLEGGWVLRGLRFDDRLDEYDTVWSRQENGGDYEELFTVANTGRATFGEVQGAVYLQDAIDVLPTRDRMVVTAGLRANYYSFNDEWTVSPRLSARLRASDRITLVGSWGLYYQQPTYRELRGELDATGEQSIEDALNRDLNSQRSMQVVLGGEYFFEKKRLYIRAEGYYKGLSDVITYTVDDIRIEYSGENDADGYIYGLDAQVRGEFVPGLESWFNYSYMVARETFRQPFVTAFNGGTVARPMDQRHTFSAFVQDYVPGDDTWKLHMRLLYGSGFPYTPPVPGPREGVEGTTQLPGPRMAGRLTAYRRMDLGATKRLTLTDEGVAGRPVTLDLTVELLNVFDMDNTVTFFWSATDEGQWRRVPRRLTPRTLNARLRLAF